MTTTLSPGTGPTTGTPDSPAPDTDAPGSLPQGGSIQVLATTPEGTRSALASAKRLASAQAARVLLLVPRVTRWSGAPPTDGERLALLDRHLALAASVGLEVTTLYCVCRRLEDPVRSLLGRSSLVVIGGRQSRWWPSREQRLARRLTAAGFNVVFAPAASDAAPRVTAGRAVATTPWT